MRFIPTDQYLSTKFQTILTNMTVKPKSDIWGFFYSRINQIFHFKDGTLAGWKNIPKIIPNSGNVLFDYKLHISCSMSAKNNLAL